MLSLKYIALFPIQETEGWYKVEDQYINFQTILSSEFIFSDSFFTIYLCRYHSFYKYCDIDWFPHLPLLNNIEDETSISSNILSSCFLKYYCMQPLHHWVFQASLIHFLFAVVYIIFKTIRLGFKQRESLSVSRNIIRATPTKLE